MGCHCLLCPQATGHNKKKKKLKQGLFSPAILICTHESQDPSLETSGHPVSQWQDSGYPKLRSPASESSPCPHIAWPLRSPSLPTLPLLLELLGELRLLDVFHRLLGIVAQLAEVVPNHSGHLVGTDLCLGSWVGNRANSSAPSPSLPLCRRLDVGGWGGVEPSH